MKAVCMAFALVFSATAALAQNAPAVGAKDCGQLKSEIAAKLDKAGVKKYQLEIMAANQETKAQVVGRCERGGKKITYTKG